MLVEPLLDHARRTPEEIALHDDGGSYTYQQLAAAAGGLATFLAGVTSRPHVAILLPSGFGFVASFYGTLLAGKSVVPINFLLGDREIAHVLRDSGVDTVLTAPPLAGKLNNSGLNIVDISTLPKTAPGAALPTPVPRNPDDMAVLIYTSGTSGLPKGVILTYANLQSDLDAAIQHARLENKHVFLGVIPLFHAFGLLAMMLAPIQLAATVIYMARFNPVAVVNTIRQRKVSLVFAVPSMFAAIAHLKNASAEDFNSAYLMISGAEPLPVPLREKFQERFGVTLYEGYGLSETSPAVALSTPFGSRMGSVGKALPGVIIKITDDNGREVGVGEVGEIWLKGPMVTRGYYNLPAETAASFTSDGFFKTGDLGRLDSDGFLFITGRKKDLIIVAGEKAAPREIEEMLLRHESVGEAAVVGKKDSSRGEVVVAFVVGREGQLVKADELRDFCRGQGLPQWKIPREIFIEKELPHSPTGKVLKRVLAERVNQV
ncbi:MAG: AMP-binding protein [Tepidisphaeraceae bacterium]|jgi:long-chain acyl-CoA synthetase